MVPNRVLMSVAATGVAGLALAQTPPVALPIPNGPGSIPTLTAPFPPAPGPVGIAPGPTLPTNNTLASFLGLSAEQREFRQRQAARTPAGQLRSRFREPLTRLTGGVIPPLVPPTPSLAELQDPGAVGAAAKVKQDRAGAEDRMKAVQYLATVDCHTWPEAEEALIGSLRADRNEAVRHQAALVLGRGCCCTKKTIKALEQSANGEDCDGFPREQSARVRAAAQAALEHCLCCFVEMESNCPDKAKCHEPPIPLEPEPTPAIKTPEKIREKEATPRMLPEREKPADAVKGKDSPVKTAAGKIDPKAFYEQVERRKSAEIVAEARKVLHELGPTNYIQVSPANPLDLQAAGFPTAVDARTQSPRSATLLEALTREEPIVTAATVAPPPVRRTVTPTPTTNVTTHAAPVPPAPDVRPVAWKSTPAVVVPAAVAPPASAPVANRTPAIQPVSAVVPAPVPVKAVTTPTPIDPKANLTNLNKLTEADFKKNPTLASVTAGQAKHSTDAAVRLACVQALVRGRAFTPQVVALFKELTNDPSPDVRVEADLGTALADVLNP